MSPRTLSADLQDAPDDAPRADVSLVIPARNAAATLRQCLAAVAPMVPSGELAEIILVDDGSTDETAEIAQSHGVTVLKSDGRGPGAARNLGWRQAHSDLIWFIDSDCVAEPEALGRLLPHMADPRVGGVGGSYGIMNPHSLLACLIHEEIVARHARMPSEVDFLATFNVLYRREVLECLQGFDERFITAQDAEFAFRARAAGYILRFEFASRVRHYHPARWWGYLRTQRKHGYWRVWLYQRHRGSAAGDKYSGLIDHGQPPMAMAGLALLPLAAVPGLRWAAALGPALLALAQLPMALRILRRTRQPRYLLFAPMSFLRAFWRGFGMVQGLLALLIRGGGAGERVAPTAEHH